MSDIKLIKEIFLTNTNGEKAKIIGLRGAEAGLECLEISTQTKSQLEEGVKTVHKIYITEELSHDTTNK